MKGINKPLLGGSLILLVTINLFNLFNLIFNVSMARLLPLSDYGVLTTLIYFVVIFAVFSESIQTVIAKYTSREDSKGKVKDIMIKSFKKAGFISIILYVVFLAAAIPLSILMNIEYYLFALIGITIITSFFIPVTRGVMQGRKRFYSFGLNMILEGIVKLLIAISLVLLGWSLYGAVLGIVIGVFCALAFSFISLKEIISEKRKKSETPKIYSYTKPVFISMFSIVLFMSLDIILAKIYFSPEMVGAYAISSTIAKIIFIGAQPISKAMFPFSSGAKREKDSKRAFTESIIFISVLILVFLAIMLIFPNIVIRLYAGRFIPESASILFYLSLAMGLLSLANLTILYNLSLGKTKGYWKLLIFVALEVILLSLFNDTLLEFSFALITATVTFLWGSIVLLKE
ncbi:oligosaccharide flippase family protein [Candidatus Pacearchaeota archaeon]|nr:oligosaccharide flippase family protein [Candidatus Pacearchaeota archaeon]